MVERTPSSEHRRASRSGAPFDLFDPAFHVAPQRDKLLTELASKDPVRWTAVPEGRGFWAVTGHAEARSVLTDPETYSSDWRLGGFRIFDLQDVTAAPRPILLSLDGQQHAEFRRVLMPLFSPVATDRLVETIEARAQSLVDAVAPLGTADFVGDLAGPMTMGLLLDLLQIGADMAPVLREWLDIFVGDDDPEFAVPAAQRRAVIQSYDSWAQTEIERRRARPRDDLLTRLMEVTIDGEPLDFDGLTTNLAALLVAAQETTRHSMANAIRLIAGHGDLRAQLRADPSKSKTMVKEFVRLSSPLMHTRRTATRAASLAGKAIEKGDKVVVWFIAANADPRVYREAFAKGPVPNNRPNGPPHLAFGAGPHYCLGWRLAEIQLAAIIEAVMRSIPDIDIAGPEQRLLSNFINGWKSLPVRFTPA